MNKYFLKDSVTIEPMIGGWFACPSLIIPLQAGSFFLNHYFPMLESYISNPKYHKDILDGGMSACGPFFHLENTEILVLLEYYRRLKQETVKACEFSTHLNDLVFRLRNSAIGESAESEYLTLPKPLDGLVEITYDINHNVNVRIIEPLLYMSEVYNEQLQTLRMYISGGEQGRYIFNRPIELEERKDSVTIRLPFKSSIYNFLGLSDTEGLSEAEFNTLLHDLQLDNRESDIFKRLFTKREYSENCQGKTDETSNKMIYLGHASVLIQAEGKCILTDPCIGLSDPNNAFSYKELPQKIDYVLITHNHQDHVVIEALMRLRSRIGCIVVPRSGGGYIQDPSLKWLLRNIGFNNVLEMGELESLNDGVVEITGIPFWGEHGELDVQSKLAYKVKVNCESYLFLADSNIYSRQFWKRLTGIADSVDNLFIGLESVGARYSWIYGSLHHDQIVDRKVGKTRRINGADSKKVIQLLETVKIKKLFIYALGLEPWAGKLTGLKEDMNSVQMKDAKNLVQYCETKNVVAKILFKSQEIS